MRKFWFGLGLFAAACHGQLSFSDPDDGGTSGMDAGLDASALPMDCRTNGGTCPLPTLRCDTASGNCVACLADSDCKDPLPRCNPTEHRCVACTTSADCPAGRACEQHVCITACDDAGKCPGNATCHAQSHLCKDCQVNADCNNAGNDRICEPNTGRCIECLDDGPCPPGRSHCEKITGRCVHCVNSSHCPSEQFICDPERLMCVRP
ncbi:hypothetical protein [Pendulispora albinea]|uniref:Dickkopf N-terminal cysteine-rich domain-containing protein n=1 Tax=Pendulispora albinea TaxID=2741071 RepID=A0ABZ2M9F8_9BACT